MLIKDEEILHHLIIEDCNICNQQELYQTHLERGNPVCQFLANEGHKHDEDLTVWGNAYRI